MESHYFLSDVKVGIPTWCCLEYWSSRTLVDASGSSSHAHLFGSVCDTFHNNIQYSIFEIILTIPLFHFNYNKTSFPTYIHYLLFTTTSSWNSCVIHSRTSNIARFKGKNFILLLYPRITILYQHRQHFDHTHIDFPENQLSLTNILMMMKNVFFTMLIIFYLLRYSKPDWRSVK